MRIELKSWLIVALIVLEITVDPNGLVEAKKRGKGNDGSRVEGKGRRDRKAGVNTFPLNKDTQKERNDEAERIATSRNSLSTRKKGNLPNESNLFAQLMRIFKVTVPGVFSDKLEKTYDLNSIKLIYPATMALVKSMKRCVITIQTKSRHNSAHAIKLELTSGLRAVYDTHTNAIRCSIQNVTSLSSKDIPVEHRANLMVQGKPNFVKYYPSQSGIVQTTVPGLSMLVYVSEYMRGSMDLHVWSLKNIRRYKPVEYETNLRVIFAKIYETLASLKADGFVYTDLKPPNILVDSKLNPYLIDLESVIQEYSTVPCVLTMKYFPPNYLASRKPLRPENMERILSWTFCMSVYETACVKSTTSAISFVLSRNPDSFIDFFKCDRKISNNLKDFLNKCLTKDDTPESFSQLKNLDWIKYDLLLLKN